MPKRSPHPKLRTSVKRGKAGQVWASFWYDMRGTGQADIPLGTDHAAALVRWAEIAAGAERIVGTVEEAFRGFESRGITHSMDGTPRKPETIKGYRKCIAALRPPFARAQWADISLPVLIQYRNARSAKGRARQELQVMSVVWGWARGEGMTELQFPGVGMQRSGWKGPNVARQVEVTDEAFGALYRHADATLRDALDIATATGLRVGDVLKLQVTDVRGDELVCIAGKTGKRADFDLSASPVLRAVIERRKAVKVRHFGLLTAKGKQVTLRMLSDRFTKARAEAAKECPEAAHLFLRDMRKRASQLSADLASASKLLQHSSLSVTQRHYRQGDKIKPVR